MMETLNRTLAPDFHPVKDIHFITPQTYTLENGQQVFGINTGEQELLRLEFTFRHHTWDASNPLLSLATNSLLNEGTSRYSAEEIAEKIDYYGAFLETDFTQDFSSVTLFTLNKHLGKVLPIFMEVLNDASFPEEEIDIFVQTRKEHLSVDLEKNAFVARSRFNKALFGNSIYGFETSHTTYDALNQKALQSFYKHTYTQDNCTLILAGKITPEVLQILSKEMKWAHPNVAASSSFDFPPITEKQCYVKKPQALQSALRLGMRTIGRNHEDYSSLQILNTVLGGYFGSRLMKNIREDKGYTYGIGSRIVPMLHGNYFFVASEVGTEVCAQALEEIYKEITILQQDLIPQEELDLVRNYMLGSILGSLENAFSHADKFKSLYLFGLDYQYYHKHIQNIKTITAAQLQQMAQQYLPLEKMVEVVVGKK